MKEKKGKEKKKLTLAQMIQGIYMTKMYVLYYISLHVQHNQWQ
jgi:hypothetical protein